MKAALSLVKSELYHVVGGKKVLGPPSGVWGDLTGVWGDLTGVRGDLTGVRGDLTGVWGDLTGVRGNLAGVRGDLSDCEITDEDRARGIDIATLIRTA